MSKQKVNTLSNALYSAWGNKNAAQFQNLLSDELTKSKNPIEQFVKKVLDEATDDNFEEWKSFWEILFKNHVHRKTFQHETSFIRTVVELGKFKILNLLLDHNPNLRQTGKDGNSVLHFLCQSDWSTNTKAYQDCMELLVNHEEIDINALNNNSETPVILAIANGNRKAVELLLSSENKQLYVGTVPGSSDLTAIKDRLLSAFKDIQIQDNYVTDNEIAIMGSRMLLMLRTKQAAIFENEFPLAMQKSQPDDEFAQNLHIILQEACKQNLENQVKLLLSFGADPSVEDEYNDSRSAISVAIENDNKEILPLLLERESLNNLKLDNNSKKFYKQDGNGNTVLHYATFYGNEKAMLEILETGGGLGVKNTKNETPLSRIPANILQQYLDKKVKEIPVIKEATHVIETKATKRMTDDKKIVFDCQFLRRENPYQLSSIELIHEISRNPEKQQLVTHPVLSSFILKKWEKVEFAFWLNFLLNALLIFSLIFEILWKSVIDIPSPCITKAIQGFLIILVSIREISQLSIDKKTYFTQFSNYLDLINASIGGYLTFIAGDYPDIDRYLEAFVVISCGLRLLVILGTHPFFTVQVEMSRIALFSMSKFLFASLGIILAIASAFVVLLNDTKKCTANNFYETVICFFSEIFRYISFSSITSNPNSSILVPITSLFVIVFLNLLTGWAAYDVKKIRENASLLTQTSRINFLTHVEKLLTILPKWLGSEKLNKRFSINYTVSFDNLDMQSCCFGESYQNLLRDAQKILDKGQIHTVEGKKVNVLKSLNKVEKLDDVSVGTPTNDDHSLILEQFDELKKELGNLKIVFEFVQSLSDKMDELDKKLSDAAFSDRTRVSRRSLTHSSTRTTVTHM